jgi:hypothetical protein
MTTDTPIRSSALTEIHRSRMTGVIVNVYRSGLGDSTNGGVTSPVRAEGKIFVVMDEAIEHGNYTFADIECDSDRYVALRLVRRTIAGREYIYAAPDASEASLDGARMFGGNFVYTSDSRLRAICDYPIPVHDRVER